MPTEWTVGTLHEHFDDRFNRLEATINQRFSNLEATIDQRFSNLDKADVKAEEVRDTSIAEAQRTIEGRLQGLNELRREVTEDRGQLVRRDVLEVTLTAMEKKMSTTTAGLDARLDSVESWRNRTIGVVTVLALGSGAIGAFVGWILKG